MTPGYQALRESAGWLDLTGRGKIVARGEDRVRLLHAMTTNHVEQLAPGGGCYAFFLDAHGHILADVNLFAMTDYILLDLEPEVTRKIYAHLDRHIVADDVSLEDVTAGYATFAVEGPRAAEVLAAAGAPVPVDAYSHIVWGTRIVARASGFLVFAPLAEREEIVRALEAAGAVAASAHDALVVRLENGRPRYGDDITEDHLAQETQQLHALHLSKGCYIGQEIVERIRARGHVNRLLVRLTLEGNQPPARGTKFPDGEITSAAYSPALGKVVALAYVRAER